MVGINQESPFVMSRVQIECHSVDSVRMLQYYDACALDDTSPIINTILMSPERISL